MNRKSTAEDLHRAALRLMRHLRTEDKALKISTARLSALSVLVFVGPQSVGSLAEIEHVSQPTMTSLAHGLASDGFIRIERSTSDRRVRRLVATRKGQNLLGRARKQRIDALVNLMAGLTDRQARTLSSAARLIESMLNGG